MKVDRLLGILAILLKNDIVTAPVLAKRFEVSRRTINRDIEDLCKAGIPLVTFQGAGGGIRIADGYKLDATLLTTKEMRSILAGLRGLDSVTGNKDYQTFLDKACTKKGIKGIKEVKEISEIETKKISDMGGNIIIDLASFYRGSLVPKINLLLEAIENGRVVTFEYYAAEGISYRSIEPCRILFQWSDWYLYGYCLTKMDFRMFKLNRITNLKQDKDFFQKREIPENIVREDFYANGQIHLVAEFDMSQSFRIVEEYGIEKLKQEGDHLVLEADFENKSFALMWILSFGDKVRICSPEYMKNEHQQIIRNMMKKYEDT